MTSGSAHFVLLCILFNLNIESNNYCSMCVFNFFQRDAIHIARYLLSYSACPSVCVFVASGIVSKRLNLSSTSTFFLATNRRYEIPTESPITRALNTGGVLY